MKKLTALLLSLLLILTVLAGCGAKNAAPAEARDSASGGYYRTETKAETAMEEPAAAEPMEEELGIAYSEPAAPQKVGGAEPVPEPDAQIGDKIIYSAEVNLETTEFDASLQSLEKLIGELGGYIQDSSVTGNTIYNSDGTTRVVDRCASYRVAVPSTRFEEMLNAAGGLGNVIARSRYAENITSQYTDTEARVESLKVQEERLLAMMKETGDIESLIKLEERLSEVTYEIESYQRTLKNWDRRVAYSTVSVYLREVEIYTPVAPVTRTFGEKLTSAFSDGWNGFCWFLEDLVLWLAESLFGLILFAAVVVLVILLVRRSVRKRRAKKTAKYAAPVSAPETDREDKS